MKAKIEKPDNRRFISSGDGVPKSASPISQAVVVANTCYASGQLPVDLDGVLRVSSIEEQVRLAFQNLVAVTRAAGFQLRDIVYVDVALTDIRDVEKVNSLFAQIFPAECRPARTVYQVAALPLGSRIKFQAIASRDS